MQNVMREEQLRLEALVHFNGKHKIKETNGHFWETWAEGVLPEKKKNKWLTVFK